MGRDLNPRTGYFINQEPSKDSLKRGEIDKWPITCTANKFKIYLPMPNYLEGSHRPHPSIFCTFQAKSRDQLHLFEKQKQGITIDNNVHCRLGLIKEKSDYGWSTNLVRHCFPLLSTSFPYLKHGRTREKNVYGSKRWNRENQKQTKLSDYSPTYIAHWLDIRILFLEFFTKILPCKQRYYSVRYG